MENSASCFRKTTEKGKDVLRVFESFARVVAGNMSFGHLKRRL